MDVTVYKTGHRVKVVPVDYPSGLPTACAGRYYKGDPVAEDADIDRIDGSSQNVIKSNILDEDIRLRISTRNGDELPPIKWIHKRFPF